MRRRGAGAATAALAAALLAAGCGVAPAAVVATPCADAVTVPAGAPGPPPGVFVARPDDQTLVVRNGTGGPLTVALTVEVPGDCDLGSARDPVTLAPGKEASYGGGWPVPARGPVTGALRFWLDDCGQACPSDPDAFLEVPLAPTR